MQLPYSPLGSTMPQSNPRVVILGAGFGGLEATKALGRAPVEITLIDRQNYHCFQPLLYQVATAALSPADIAWPFRHILRRQKNATAHVRGENLDFRNGRATGSNETGTLRAGSPAGP